MPIFKILYNAQEKNSHHIYMALIILLILSEDDYFNKAVHETVSSLNNLFGIIFENIVYKIIVYLSVIRTQDPALLIFKNPFLIFLFHIISQKLNIGFKSSFFIHLFS